ncbi:MAG: Holliday junction DNA helicase RuvA [Alphaproteobacteria bacterium]|jgi:Holliday junction DNA helicase RuvA
MRYYEKIALLTIKYLASMFASLSGIIQKKYADSVILSVHGVGYKVLCHAQAIAQIEIGEAYFFFIETMIGEDFIKLFGFLTEAEKNWFLTLSSVQGVGGKAALAILSVANPSMISDAILLGDRAIVTKAAGVGPKLADRIINELKHKKELPPCYDNDETLPIEDITEQTIIAPPISKSITKKSAEKSAEKSEEQKQFIQKRKIIDSATSALINLGYTRPDSLRAITEVQSDETLISENTLIMAALKKIAQLKEDN